MPCPFTGRKMFCASPNFLIQPKNLNAFSASHKHIARQKDNLHSVFCAGTKVFEDELNAVKFLGCLKKFGPAQNI